MLSTWPPVFLEEAIISDSEKKGFSNHFFTKCTLVKKASAVPNLEYNFDGQLNHFDLM